MRTKLTLITAVMMLAALLVGCGSSAAKNVNIDDLASSLVTGIAYDDELSKVSDDEISYYMEVADDVKCVMYMGSGTTAEEVAVFEAPDAARADSTKADVEGFLQEQKASFKDYIPEEAKRIEDAVLEQKGNYVILCVSGDSEKAEAIIDEAFGK